MAVRPDRPDRDAKDDARAREWAEKTRREGTAGELTDDSELLARKLADEKRKLKRV